MSLISISAAVGIKASNRNQDVTKVQVVLNHFIGNRKLVGIKPLVIDGKCGSKTNEALMAFQIQNGLLSEEHFTGQIRPGGMTISFMNKNAGYIPPGGSSETEWDYYKKSSYASSTTLLKGVKKWLSKKPRHRVEVGLFSTKHPDGRRIIFWRSEEPGKNCVGEPANFGRAIQSYTERPTSLEVIRREHGLKDDLITLLGNDTGAKMIAALNDGWNTFMAYYVLNKGMCVRNAKWNTHQKLAQEAKAQLNLVVSLVGEAWSAQGPMSNLAGGPKGPKGRGEISLPDEIIRQFTAVPWDKSKDVFDLIFKIIFKSNIHIKKSYQEIVRHIKVIYDEDGEKVIGYVQYFD